MSEIASVGLGFKSLQNDFFYLDAESVARRDIENEYLTPIYQLRDLSHSVFLQKQTAKLWLFNCRVPERELRGTKALAYIRAMGNKPAAVRKQTKSESTETIKQVLEKQGGGVWYYPKATVHGEKVWVRKAFNTVYAPFLFEEPAVVDQRCNFLRALEDVDGLALAAVVTATVFAFALEVEGAAALGQGALEVPTNSLNDASVLNVRRLAKDQLQRLVALAEKVWEHEAPTDWSEEKTPGPRQAELDAFVLRLLTPTVKVETLYRDLSDLCRDRVSVGSQKGEMKKDTLSADVDTVVERIAHDLEPSRDRRRFPEGYLHGKEQTSRVELPEKGPLRVGVHPLLTEAEITIDDEQGRTLLSSTVPRSIAAVIAAALLSGRRSFAYPSDEEKAAGCYAEFRKDLDALISRIDDGVRSSALGTKYEAEVKKRVFRQLELDMALESHEGVFGTFVLGR